MTAGRAGVGMGLHPFGDPRIRDESSVEDLAIDARDLHTYAAEWTPEHVAFFIDHRLVKLVSQSPACPMQFMLGVYEFPDGGEAGRPAPARPYPKEFVVDSFRAYRSVARSSCRAGRWVVGSPGFPAPRRPWRCSGSSGLEPRCLPRRPWSSVCCWRCWSRQPARAWAHVVHRLQAIGRIGAAP